MKASLTIQELAEDKHLDKKYLESLGISQNGVGVVIPYHNEDMELIRCRIRTACKAKDGSLWGPGNRTAAYGLWRLEDARKAGYLIIVEGESDCWTLWNQGFPALGIPGATMTKVLEASHVKDIPTIYIIKEPGQSGAIFVAGISERLASFGYAGTAKVVSLEPYKDPNEFYQAHPEQFASLFQEMLDTAETIELKAEQPSVFNVSRPDIEIVPELPRALQIPQSFEKGSSIWLDNHIALSRKYSPRGADGYHEAVGLFILSTVAARRIYIWHGRKKYTPLYIMLVGRTSLHAKSTTAEIGIDLLRQAGLDYLLIPESITAQMFIRELSGIIPPKIDKLPPEERQRLELQLAFSAQRGWYYDEFSQHLSAMNREGSSMADFKGILRRLDDCSETYEHATISRGKDFVRKPYLSFLGMLTPADLRPFARAGNAFWNDGFWARFAFILPESETRKRAQLPMQAREIPRPLITALREMHEFLGTPKIEIQDQHIRRVSYPEKACTVTPEVATQFTAYGEALLDMTEEMQHGDFDGNYARFAEKAMRIAMLLAAIENNFVIEMCHWARAQSITERWRRNLHHLMSQVNEGPSSHDAQKEEQVLRALTKLGKATAWDVSRYIRGMSAAEASKQLEALHRNGVLQKEMNRRKTFSYRINE